MAYPVHAFYTLRLINIPYEQKNIRFQKKKRNTHIHKKISLRAPFRLLFTRDQHKLKKISRSAEIPAPKLIMRGVITG